MFGFRPRFSLVLFCACLSMAAVKAPAAAPAPGTQINSAVTLSYTTLDDATPQAVRSNVASFLVGQIAGVTVTPRAASQTAATNTQPRTFPLVIHNTGTGRDQFKITVAVPSGWSAALVQADGKTPLVSPVTLAADQTLACSVILRLPSHTDGSTQKTVVHVTSQVDATVSAEADLSVVTPAPAPVPDTTLRVGWAVRTGAPVLGGAVVWNGIAFVGSDDGYLYAITATGPSAGSVAWRFNTGMRVRCTPAVYAVPDGRTLVTVGNDAGMLTTLDAVTGQSLWARQVGGGQMNSWRSQPQISVNGTLVTVPDNQGGLCSYSTLSGALLSRLPWAHWFLVGDPAASGPDGRAWLMTTSGWGNEVLGGLPGRSLYLPLPTLSGLTLDTTANSLLAVSADGHVFSYDPTTLNPNLRWNRPIKQIAPHTAAQDLDTASLTLRPVPASSVNLGAAVDASPALDPAGGTLYIGAEDHKVYALGTADGRPQSGWPFAPGGIGHFLAKPLAWPTVAGGVSTLYLGDTDGVFYAVPTDHPDRPLSFTTRLDGEGVELFGEWDAAPAASGTTANDVVVAGNTNGVIYGFLLR